MNIAPTQLQVQPDNAGVTKGTNTQLSQNEAAKEPEADPKADLVVHFTISNGTTNDTALQIDGANIDQPKMSPKIVATGNAQYTVALPTGHYTIQAADIPTAKPAPFDVGPLRPSSQQDLLLP